MKKKVLVIWFLLVFSVIASGSNDWVRPLQDLTNITTAHANLYYHNDSSPLTIAIPTFGIYFNITGLTEYNTKNILTDNDSIMTILYDGQYFIMASISFSGGASREYEMELFLNEVPVMVGCELHRKMGTGGDMGNANLVCNLELIQGDQLRIKMEDETNPTADANAKNINFHIHKISGFQNNSVTLNNYLRNDGDTATGNYSFDTNTLFIDSSNDRIGIGTNTPLGKLTIISDDITTSATGFRLQSGTTGNYQYMYMGSNAAGTYSFIQAFQKGVAATDLILQNTAGSKLGVGTTSPGRKLDVSEASQQIIAAFKSASSTSGRIGLSDAQTANDARVGIGAADDDLTLYAGGAERIRMIANGNLGLGATIPAEKLQIVGGNILLDNTQVIKFKDSVGTARQVLSVKSDNSVNLGGSNLGDLYFYAGGGGVTVRAFIESTNGNVGIGTITPSYPLEVGTNVSGISIYAQGNISASGYITRTDVYDKSSNALDEINDKNYYLNPDGSINHNAFGYSSVSYKKQVVDYYNNISYDYIVSNDTITSFFNKTINDTQYNIIYKNITLTSSYLEPVMKEVTEEGIDLVKEVAMLKQAIHELNQKIILLEAVGVK